MDHRRFLNRPDAHRPFAGGDLFARVGGRAAVEALIEGLYDRIETDAALRPLFGRDLVNEREAQKRFFTEWLGGDAVYSDRAHTPLKHRHDLLPITRALAGEWLAHFRGALEAAVQDESARRGVYERTCVLAMALAGLPPRPPRQNRLRCLRFAAEVAPGPRKTRDRLVANLGRAGLLPAWSR
jgi:hemoglobin